jgi:purine-nucleoside phosphorylase
MGLYEEIQETAAAIRARAPSKEAASPAVAVVLGSGLGSFADRLAGAAAVPYQDLPNFPRSSVDGHAGRLVLGALAGVPVVAMQGRVHAYEGYPQAQVAFPARVLCALGVRTLVVTNAAGGINATFRPGDLMAITDHINLSGGNPLSGPNDPRLGERFPDMTHAYDVALLERLRACADQLRIPLRSGVYANLPGPSYETPAEIRMLRALGADAVGMSTVPEVIAARHMKVRVVGVSCITNVAAGISEQPLSHAEVKEVAGKATEAFSRLLLQFLPVAAKE